MSEQGANIAASVRARLLNLARARGQPLDLLLARYVLERLLYRLSLSPHRRRFALKGAMLVSTWFKDPIRPTRDLDLLGFGAADAEAMMATFREVCAIEAQDGVIFDGAALSADAIRDESDYGGLRLKTHATLAGARIRVVIDIGFGDATEPGLAEVDLPVLLDLPAPRLETYAPETVIAEKFQAMVALGRANSRVKDFYDIWMLAKVFDFAGDRLARGIAATFARRGTPVPEDLPDALSPTFAADPAKQRQWDAFLEQVAYRPGTLEEVIADLAAFLMRHARAAAQRSGGE